MVEVPEELIGLIAVLTLPVGILVGWAVGFEAAAVVFVVGWLALVPGLAVLRDWLGDEENPAAGAGTAMEPRENPLETLRERYARGEIGDAEFERRLEELVATEDGPERPRSEPERELEERPEG